MDNEQLLQALEKRFDSIDKRFDKIETDITEIKGDVTSIKGDILSINVTLENDVSKHLGALSDGHKMLYDKLSRIDDLANDIDEIKGAIVAVELRVDGRI